MKNIPTKSEPQVYNRPYFINSNGTVDIPRLEITQDSRPGEVNADEFPRSVGKTNIAGYGCAVKRDHQVLNKPYSVDNRGNVTVY